MSVAKRKMFFLICIVFDFSRGPPGNPSGRVTRSLAMLRGSPGSVSGQTSVHIRRWDESARWTAKRPKVSVARALADRAVRKVAFSLLKACNNRQDETDAAECRAGCLSPREVCGCKGRHFLPSGKIFLSTNHHFNVSGA